MIINLSGEVNDLMVDDLVDAINTGENLTVFLNSEGGYVHCLQVILKLINDNKAKISLVGYGQLSSAAFEIFFRAECHKELLPLTFGMTHLASSLIRVDERGGPKDNFASLEQEELKKQYENSLAFYKKIGLSPKEIKDAKAGKDVLFSSERLKQLWEKNL